jgi:integrase
MPAQSISDAWIKNLTWAKAVRILERERRERGDNEPFSGVQISFFDTLQRGLALALILGEGGTKSLRAVIYRAGRPVSRKLGVYPALGIKDARALARQYFEDPSKFVEKAEVGTVRQICEQYLEEHVAHNHLRSERETRRIMVRYIYPRIGAMKFLEVRRQHVSDLLFALSKNHGAPMADAVLARLRAVMRWYGDEKSEEYVSPISTRMRADKRKPDQRRRSRFLSDDEIRLLWMAVDQVDPVYAALIKCLLLTGSRREKAAAMRWCDITIDQGVWTWMPHREDREKSVVPKLRLPAMLVEILQTLPRIQGNEYVFATSARGHFTAWALRKGQLDRLLGRGFAGWVHHDLRRTFRKLLTRCGVRPDVGELCLGHSIEGIRAVYDDPTEYQVLIDHAVQRVADEVARILNPPRDNVVAIASKKRQRRK